MDTQALWREFNDEDPIRAKALRDRLILTYAPCQVRRGRLGSGLPGARGRG